MSIFFDSAARILSDSPRLAWMREWLLAPPQSIRVCKAKRRLAAGEFPTLHEAQAAIAREHGLPTWAALKQQVSASEAESQALTKLRWLIARFCGADQVGWTAPDDDEMRAHFDDRFLTVIPAEEAWRPLNEGACPYVKKS